MNCLIIYSHPNPKSFCHAIMETFNNGLKEQGHKVRIRDLYAMNFAPALSAKELESLDAGIIHADLMREQKNISWADVITFIYPLWWASLPAILKGYVDRVLSLGFAYSYGSSGPIGLLTDKKIFMITTMGAPIESYEKTGMFHSMKQTVDEGISEFCGMKDLGHKYFGSVANVSQEERLAMLCEVRKIANSIK